VASKIFEPWVMGPYTLANRVAMAPMTRNRADDDGVPSSHAVEYYHQRAGAGLIISEATQPSAAGRGYFGTPGIHSQQQQDAWAPIADAVHAEGGHIFLQLMHTGRIGHTSLLPAGGSLMAPSAVRAEMEVDRDDGVAVPAETPRAFTVDEIHGVIDDYASAAERAVAAGMDGIELHGANGYLIHQFLGTNTNLRDDEYGGSPEGRARFVVELTTEVSRRIGPERIGLRISPGGRFNDMREVDNDATYLALVEALAPSRIAYLHTLRRRSTPLHQQLRAKWPTTFILNTGYQGSSDLEVLEEILVDDAADLVSVGRYFISNPDLVHRWRTGAPLAAWDEDTFYTHGPEGLIDYAFHQRTTTKEIHHG
jgi:N-ethylmaleimide reductase